RRGLLRRPGAAQRGLRTGDRGAFRPGRCLAPGAAREAGRAAVPGVAAVAGNGAVLGVLVVGGSGAVALVVAAAGAVAGVRAGPVPRDGRGTVVIVMLGTERVRAHPRFRPYAAPGAVVVPGAGTGSGASGGPRRGDRGGSCGNASPGVNAGRDGCLGRDIGLVAFAAVRR